MMVHFVAPELSWDRPTEWMPEQGDIIVYNDHWYVVRNRKLDLDLHTWFVYVVPQEEFNELKAVGNLPR
jgi:hypothetical protein